MNSRATSRPARRIVSLFSVLAMITSMVFMISGDLLAERCEDVCENHCDETSNECSGCTHCLPLQHLILQVQPECDQSDDDPSWSVDVPSPHDESTLPDGIDHPPKDS